MDNEKRTHKHTMAPGGPEGEFPREGQGVGTLEPTIHKLEILRENTQVLEEILSRENMMRAWQQTKRNKGAPGVDGKNIEETYRDLQDTWPAIKESLYEGSYKPQPTREVEIPKNSGGTRKLSIPTVTDRLIQQAIAQVLSGYIDDSFDDDSYGYRPNRSQHQAVHRAKHYIDEGYKETIDIDMENYFGTVNQDRLMSQLRAMIGDQRVLNLIRKILNAASKGGIGLSQGGPLSPFLSNVYLDPLDKELRRRGHRFVRYADDCKVFVRSEKSGHRVLESIRKVLGKRLKLKTNDKKSGVSKMCYLLGFQVNERHIGFMSAAIKRLKDRVREIVRIRGGKAHIVVLGELEVYLRGWKSYYDIQTRYQNPYQGLNSWIRRRVRAMIYKSYKNGGTRYRAFRSGGIREHVAYTCAYASSGPWSMACCKAMRVMYSNSRLKAMGLYTL